MGLLKKCSVLLIAVLATGAGLTGAMADEPEDCTYCKLTDEAMALGPPCAPTAWSACAPLPIMINCPAGQPQPNTKWPPAGHTVGQCKPSAEPKECTVILNTPWPETECRTDGNGEITSIDCPQNQWKWRCKRTRQTTGGQILVNSCADSPDPECQPSGGG